MTKKAQDFLVDSALGEKSYDLSNEQPEEKIQLTIEQGAVPVAMLKDAAAKAKTAKTQSIFKRADDALRSLGKPTAKDKATFFRLLAIMLNAGVPLIKSLDTIAEQTVNHRLKKALYEMARGIEKGGTFSASMALYPEIFSEGHLGMIKSGEASGQLNHILLELATQVEKNAAILRKVRGALMYPAFIIIVMVAVICAMMVFVVPKISEVFMESSQQLPLLTRIVVATAHFMKDKWWVIFGGVIALVLAFMGIRNSKQGRYATDTLLLKLPVVGMLVQKSILARFSRSLGNLLGSGVPIVQGLKINANSLGNETYRRRVQLAAEDVARGIPLGESLRDTPEFPAMMVQMVAVGEQTAQLDTIAVKVAEYYEEEIDTLVASLSSVLEPLILVVVGVVVGGIAGAVLLPLIQLTQMSGAL